MSDIDIKELESYERRISLRKECLKDLFFAVKYFHYLHKSERFIPEWYHKLICEHLMNVYLGETKKLLITMPPGYGKTTLQMMFVAFAFAKVPNCRFIHSSYEKELCNKNSNIVKTVIETDYENDIEDDNGKLIKVYGYQNLFPEVRLSKNVKSKANWETTAGGSFYAVPFGGGITGFHAGQMTNSDKFKFTGCYLIDDPNKVQEMKFKNYRDTIIQTYTDVLYSRYSQRDIPTILIQQRIHQEDLAGYILENEIDDWVHLMIPAILKKKDYWYFTHTPEDKRVGNPEEEVALCPRKHTLEDLYKKKNSKSRSDRMTFASQFMQRPAPEEGNLFTRDGISHYNVVPDYFLRDFTTIDTAQNTENNNDLTAMGYFNQCNDGLYWIALEHGHFSLPTMRDKLFLLDDIYKPGRHYIELQANGHALRQLAQSERLLPIEMFDAGMSRKLNTTETGKMARAEIAATLWNQGYVKLPEKMSWVKDIIDQLLNFPNAAHDELVDILSMAILATRVLKDLHPSYVSVNHLTERLSNVPSHLLYVWNTIGIPACLVAQVTDFNQIRILDFEVMEGNVTLENFIERLIRKHQGVFAGTKPKSLTILMNEPEVEGHYENPWNNFPQLLHQKYGIYPTIPRNFRMKYNNLSNTVDTLNEILLKNVVNPETNMPEPMFVVVQNAVMVDKGLSGGITLDSLKSKINDRNSWILAKTSPYLELGQCLYHLIYHFYINLASQRVNLYDVNGNMLDSSSSRSVIQNIRAIY